jgi:hypothetical protein
MTATDQGKSDARVYASFLIGIADHPCHLLAINRPVLAFAGGDVLRGRVIGLARDEAGGIVSCNIAVPRGGGHPDRLLRLAADQCTALPEPEVPAMRVLPDSPAEPEKTLPMGVTTWLFAALAVLAWFGVAMVVRAILS